MNALPSIETLYDVCAQTWPAAVETQVGPWTIRDGQGGGQRTSAATVQGAFGLADLDLAERSMRSLGQDVLFMVREGETELDDMLESQGYQIKDPVNVYACPINVLTDVEIPRVTAFSIWEPLQIMRDIWAKGGITEARVSVMERSTCVKTGLFSRWNEKPGGTGYAAIHDGIAMVHALEILAHQRGKGVGKWMMRRAAFWARDHGATDMSVICTKGNDAANALYTSLGMTLIGGYHYRVKTD